MNVLNFDWYTDRADVFRVVKTRDGALTRQERRQILTDVPCRVYRSNNRPIIMNPEAASVSQDMKLACANGVDIRAGDEIIVHRGGGLGKTGYVFRTFAGDPDQYFEPFGAVIPGLAHQEITLLQQERVKNGSENTGGAD